MPYTNDANEYAMLATMLDGKTLRTLRGAAGLTQAALAERAHVAANAIADFETGKRDIRVDTLRKLLHALGAEVSYTVDGARISGM